MFRLLRHSWLTSLASMLVVAACLAFAYRPLATALLVAMGESENAVQARLLAAALQPDLAQFRASPPAGAAAGAGEPASEKVTEAVPDGHWRWPTTAKARVYDLSGRMIAANDDDRSGPDRSARQGFQAARGGSIATELTRDDRVSPVSLAIEKRDLLSTYVPVRETPDGPVAAVLEVYATCHPRLPESTMPSGSRFRSCWRFLPCSTARCC